jgi:ATP-dependent helicase/nuclease subunit B
MALRLLYGSSVSKKTAFLYQALIDASEKHPDRNFIIVVPEQASLQVQEAIVALHPRHAVSNIDILTFNRLAFKVFSDCGAKTRETLDDYGKIMLLRLVTIEQKGDLEVLSRGISKTGMLEELKSVISELAQYNISPDVLAKKAEELTAHPPLQKKLRDLARIYRAFMEAVHEKREIAEERIARLAGVIGKWPGARRTTIAFDGFTGFTAPQYEVLRALLGICPEVIVGVTAGSGELLSGADPGANDWIQDNKDESALFRMSSVMAAELKRLALMESVEYTEKTIPDNGPFAPEILFLEKHLYRTEKAVYPRENTAVRLVKARKRKDEVAWVLHEIMKGIREDGLRPRDFAVIAGDLQGDREEIEEQFSEAGIPCFIDMQKPLGEDPLVRFLQDALRVTASKFDFDPLISFAKNPIVIRLVEKKAGSGDSFSAFERIAEVENFARARGFHYRSQYEGEWSAKGRQFYESRFPVINETKDILFSGLIQFDDRMNKAVSVSDRIEAVRTLLSDYDAEETLKDLAEAFRGENELRNEYLRVYEKILTDLGRFEDIFEEKALDQEMFSAVLQTGLQSLVMGHVPPTKDRVVIGDLRRTRLRDIRRLFVIGANEGVLPMDHAGGGLLSDYDREILREEKIELSATAREMAAEDRYYLYLLLTKASEQLVLSYRAQGDDGSAMLPGELPGMMKRLFEDLTEEDTEAAELSGLNSVQGGIALLSAAMRDYLEKAREGEAKNLPETSKRALFQWYQSHPEHQKALDQIFEGLFYSYEDSKEALSPETAAALWSETLQGSVSFFEKYAECPYGHFLKYGLKLNDRAQYEVTTADLGTVLHDSIDEIFKRSGQGTNWYELEGDALDELIREVVREKLDETNNGIFTESARMRGQYDRIIRIVTRTLKTLAEQWKAGSYTETKTELSFGYDRKELPGLTIPLADGRKLALKGRIDRVDTLRDGENIYVKIIDYKSSARALDATKVWYGLQLQLPLYLKAAIEMEEKEHPEANVIPGGLYYYGISDPIQTPKSGQDTEELIRKELVMQGLTNTDPDAVAKLDRAPCGMVAKNIKANNDGSLSKSAGSVTATAEELRAIGEFARKKAKELAESVISGVIPVKPYAYGSERGCTFCSFHGICGFDRMIKGYEYNELEKKENADLTSEEKGGAE